MDVTPTRCTLCPRKCRADRTKRAGFCGAPGTLRVARAALHHWEEPCISGTNGSGTIFFSGCPLRCCYCQNYAISAEGLGKNITTERLAEIFLELQAQGAHNINLVTAAPYVPWIIEARKIAGTALHIPFVYNTSGYESADIIRMLSDVVDVWLADLKYVSAELSGEYSQAPDYFPVAFAALRQMCELAGAPVYGNDGTLHRGVIVRHLLLPGCLSDTFEVLHHLAALSKELPFLISLMSQYTPFYKAKEHRNLSRRISTYEYRKAVDFALSLGLDNGFLQEKSSAKEEYTPPFDLMGV